VFAHRPGDRFADGRPFGVDRQFHAAADFDPFVPEGHRSGMGVAPGFGFQGVSFVTVLFA
jgi:hypothetical protein